MTHIRVIAIAVIARPSDGALLVYDGYDTVKRQLYHRKRCTVPTWCTCGCVLSDSYISRWVDVIDVKQLCADGALTPTADQPPSRSARTLLARSPAGRRMA